MELREALRRRRMVRAFSPEPLADDVVDRLAWAFTRAPSAGNSQGADLLLLTAAEDRARFWDAAFPERDPATFSFPTLFDAPCLAVPLAAKGAYLDRYAEPDKGWGDRDEGRWPVPYWHVDGGMAVGYLLLAAVDEGLGALLFGVFGEHVDAVRAAFGVPDDRDVLGAVAIGHRLPDRPGLSAASRPRRGVDDVVHRGRW